MTSSEPPGQLTEDPPADPSVPSPSLAPQRVQLPVCANCGAETTSRFCPDCGQEMRDTHLSLPQLLHEFTDEYLNVDSRVMRSIGSLLFRPGHLTRAYIEGKRQRHVRPFRMYLIASILFFTVLTLSMRSSFMGAISVGPEADAWFAEEFGPPGGTAEEPEAAEAGEDADAPGGAAGEAGVPEAAADGQVGEADEVAEDGADVVPQGRLTFEQRMKLRAEQVQERGVSSFVQSAAQQFWSDLPKLMFVLLPFFALFLKLLYVRSGRSYVEHFIFSLHTHSFVFIVFTALVLLRAVPYTGWLAATIPLYVFLAQKRVYGQGFLKRSIKYFLLGTAYFTAVLVALVATIVLILLLV